MWAEPMSGDEFGSPQHARQILYVARNLRKQATIAADLHQSTLGGSD
jgi:hypothetical protein